MQVEQLSYDLIFVIKHWSQKALKLFFYCLIYNFRVSFWDSSAVEESHNGAYRCVNLSHIQTLNIRICMLSCTNQVMPTYALIIVGSIWWIMSWHQEVRTSSNRVAYSGYINFHVINKKQYQICYRVERSLGIFFFPISDNLNVL